MSDFELQEIKTEIILAQDHLERLKRLLIDRETALTRKAAELESVPDGLYNNQVTTAIVITDTDEAIDLIKAVNDKLFT
jgi:hypothetical protein